MIKNVFFTTCLLALISAPGFSNAQSHSGISADLPNSHTMATQRKVDKVFESGDFERAFFLYQNELAPLGDKYAQYMVGYMYLTGRGVEENRITASAWYRLAAERGTPEFVNVRDQLLRKLQDDEMSRSDAEYLKLRAGYSDLVVLLASIKRNLAELEGRTGTRIQSDRSSISPMISLETQGGRMRSGSDYYGVIFGQLEDRVKLLIEIGEFENMDSDPARINLRDLESRVQERIQSID
ncbi:MAG: hypothetical protein MUO51_16825 [Woeseiaceae bacterium]|nr:hypothetical protein [Woeseiaceae bacterium]